ncbi:hypothetical protein MRB53_036498 [Persea americana]|nr:hypothetical protein MRB53_042415 [Persea americana]KAJ8614190.1 hypothetical protein MRB53_036666 [Persea americana]KAJ8614632.1 hypothetical protein MRB53_036498 [Persea americana]
MQRGRDDVTYYDHVQKCCPLRLGNMEPLNCSRSFMGSYRDSTGEKEVGFTEEEGAGACGPPSAASASWTPTPVSREGAGLCFPSGRPVAAENELGWAPRGSRFLVKRAYHSLIEARVHAGDGRKSFHDRRRAASSLSDRNKKRELVVGGKTRLVECDSTEEPSRDRGASAYSSQLKKAS